MRKKVCTIKEIWSRNCTLGGLGDAPLLPKLYRLFVVMEKYDGNPINAVWVVWVLVVVDSPPCPDAVGSAPPPPPPNPPRPPPPPPSLERSLLKATHWARETPLH